MRNHICKVRLYRKTYCNINLQQIKTKINKQVLLEWQQLHVKICEVTNEAQQYRHRSQSTSSRRRSYSLVSHKLYSLMSKKLKIVFCIFDVFVYQLRSSWSVRWPTPNATQQSNLMKLLTMMRMKTTTKMYLLLLLSSSVQQQALQAKPEIESLWISILNIIQIE